MKKMKIVILLLTVVSASFANTRWTSVRYAPTADFVGMGRFVANYNIFLNTPNNSGMSGYSLFSLTAGASEHFEGTLGYADGMNFGFKGLLLKENTGFTPAVALGIRNMFHNEMLARSRLKSDIRAATGELFVAFGKDAIPFGTSFHGGLLSLPDSDKDIINGFFAIEKYFDDDFFLTFEGFSQQKRFYLALTATLRFMRENRSELYFSLLDLERMFFTRNHDFSGLLTPMSREDWVKPGLLVGFSFSFGAKAKDDDEIRFRTQEKKLAHHDLLIREINLQIDTLKYEKENLNLKTADLQSQTDSLKAVLETLDLLPLYHNEVYSRLVAYTFAYSAERFDPLEVRRILDEVRRYGREGEKILAKIVREERQREIRIRAITMLGELRARDKIPLLLEGLESTLDSREKIEIIATLGKIGDRSLRPKIEEFADSNDGNLRLAANEVLDLWNNSDISQENIPLDRGNDVFSVEPLE
jgi:hypothetical protein